MDRIWNAIRHKPKLTMLARKAAKLNKAGHLPSELWAEITRSKSPITENGDVEDHVGDGGMFFTSF